ncbi:hypothetical protein [Rhizobium sp. Root482]|uniref:hypothetical protein n=1 Tax=Rhizobium sp. Root482 TaxID=1736543 RepID=UPI0006FF9294|nr:hypothetical protein [Rhizobium sp. Root482]KQY27202.1 hypothetical protein ASD31_03195 [Rhizobium sp. Root482]
MLKNLLSNATRQQKVEAVAEAMIRLEPNATAENIKSLIGITQTDLDSVADDARAEAYQRQNGKPRVRVPVDQAA